MGFVYWSFLGVIDRALEDRCLGFSKVNVVVGVCGKDVVYKYVIKCMGRFWVKAPQASAPCVDSSSSFYLSTASFELDGKSLSRYLSFSHSIKSIIDAF
jgi:hypothetical protein